MQNYCSEINFPVGQLHVDARAIRFSTYPVSTNNKIFSRRNVDNTYVYTDTNNSTSTGDKRWQYRLTAYHKHITMLGAKRYWSIEITNIKIPKAIWLQQLAVIQQSKTTSCKAKPVHWNLKSLSNLIPNKTEDTNFLHIKHVKNNVVS